MSKILHIVIARDCSPETVSLCNILTEGDDVVALHIDQKSTSQPIPEAVLFNPNVILTVPRISVYHGDFSIIQAILHSFNHCKYLLENSDYVNIISSQDYPTRPLSQLHTFLKANPGKIFLNYNPLPILDGKYHHGANNQDFADKCIWPFETTPEYFFDRINPDNYLSADANFNILKLRSYAFEKKARVAKILTFFQKFKIVNRMISIGRRFRKIPKINMYAGSAWGILSVSAMDEVIQFFQNKENRKTIQFFKQMKYPDEFVFQTILVNCGKFDMVNSDLHYINWQKADVYGRPAMIDASDIPLIKKSNAFFCRKVSPEIIPIIHEELIEKAK